jgi:hypothetical protein
MATIIMTISLSARVDEKEIERHRKNYKKANNAFIVKYTDAFIPNGYLIKKVDNLVEHIKSLDKENEEVRAQIYHQALKIKDSAQFSQDQTILAGEKPYEPNNDNPKYRYTQPTSPISE